MIQVVHEIQLYPLDPQVLEILHHQRHRVVRQVQRVQEDHGVLGVPLVLKMKEVQFFTVDLPTSN